MNYILDFKGSISDNLKFTAFKKAPADIERTLHNSIGAVPLSMALPDSDSLSKNLVIILRNLVKFLSVVRKGDQIFIQTYGHNKFIHILTSLVKRWGVKFNYIVHDIHFLRWNGRRNDLKEVEFLNNFDCLYVHTEAMEKRLRMRGIECDMKIVHLFDYYSDDPMMSKDKILDMKNVVAFAGNLDKSMFLEQWAKTSHLCDISVCLYGTSQDASLLENANIHYAGAFKPNNTGTLMAGWGLLWDGDSTETCAGELGEYLKVNSSHKLSLYLACGIPVIVWSQSSLAGWLTEQGVCLTVDSLDDIPNAIHKISEKQYSEMIDNSIKLGKKLRNGEMLKALL